jgi:sugar/nucleoside kinase (ribokinase family)
VTERARIVVFGDVIDDVVVVPHGPIRPDTDTVSSIRRSAGGSAANTAAWLGTLGAEVDFVGVVGLDDLERHRALLAVAGVTPHLTGDPEQQGATRVAIVHAIPNRAQARPQQATAELGTEAAHGLLAQSCKEVLAGALCGLERDVAHEAVTHRDVAGSGEQVLALDAAGELHRRRLEQRIRLLHQLRTLARLLAVAHQPDSR